MKLFLPALYIAVCPCGVRPLNQDQCLVDHPVPLAAMRSGDACNKWIFWDFVHDEIMTCTDLGIIQQHIKSSLRAAIGGEFPLVRKGL